jgi:hypothetical protein
VNFPFICSNIPAAPTYGVSVSQLIRYSRTCGSYQDIIDRGLLLTRKLLNQGFLLVKLKSSLKSLLYEVCLIRIKEQVGEKRNTVCTHRYAECLLTNTLPNITNMLSIKNSSMLMISVSENCCWKPHDMLCFIYRRWILLFIFCSMRQTSYRRDFSRKTKRS